MARPSNWLHSPTTAIRVPEQFADALLSIAKQMDEGKWSDGSQDSVQNLPGTSEKISSVEMFAGDRVRLISTDPYWNGREAEILSFIGVNVRLLDEDVLPRELYWRVGDNFLERIGSAAMSPNSEEIAAEPLEEEGSSPADAALLDRLVDKALAECDRSGVAPEKLLLYLKEKELIEFLSRFRKQDRHEFVVRIMDEIFDRREVTSA